MLVLIDESLPRQLRLALSGHGAQTVAQMGWLGTRNGELLRRADAVGFDALITADRNLEFQQNVARLGFGVIVLMVSTTKKEDVLALVPSIGQALDQIKPGRVIRIGVDSRGRRSRRS